MHKLSLLVLTLLSYTLTFAQDNLYSMTTDAWGETEIVKIKSVDRPVKTKNVITITFTQEELSESPTRVTLDSDTLYLLNDKLGRLIYEVWTQPMLVYGGTKIYFQYEKVPVIIFVNDFEAIDRKKIAFVPRVVGS